MAEHADDEIERGMVGDWPARRRRQVQLAQRFPIGHMQEDYNAPLTCDDQYTSWFDHDAPGIREMSQFDACQWAFQEGWRRALASRK